MSWRPALTTAQSLPAAHRGGPRAFASVRALGADELREAPVRYARPSRLEAPLNLPAGRLADGAAALGLVSVGRLLEHLPRDRREGRTVSTLIAGEQATVAVQVRSIGARAVRRAGMRPLVEASVFDGTGSMRATFFNQPWLVARYPPGTRLVLHGKAETARRFRVSHHAIGQELRSETTLRLDDVEGFDRAPAPAGAGVAPGEHADSHADVGGVSGSVAHYPASEGITSTQILTMMASARPALVDVPERLPGRLRAAEGLPDRGAALDALHFPPTANHAEVGRVRLAFEELLLGQLAFARRRSLRQAHGGAQALAQPGTLSARWREHLPFALTRDQHLAIAAIDDDLARTQPMQRLLMGEVGSGKTVVALHAMLRAVEHGRQAALMAPTATLAEQHFSTLARLMGGETVTCALLTGSTAARRRADTLAKLGSGELSLIVGTHALIEPAVRFRALSVVVVDEQHRFGVRQRAALDAKGAAESDLDGATATVVGDRPDAHAPTRAAHVLHMTATPIPRTLALVGYGDLEVSALHDLPSGRRPVSTRIVTTQASRARAYAHLREQLRAGRQAFVVCPLVEQADAPPAPAGAHTGEAGVSGGSPARARPALLGEPGEQARAAVAEFERLVSGELKGFRVMLLHGQMPPRARQEAMAAFAAARVDVLVATTVVEVGIDVPNATVMLVENAERFGISQLHQLRGRIGRSEHPSTCLLVGPPGSPRLRALAEHGDGFALAEIDLELRKEGDLAGTRQSGMSQFRIARLPEDRALLERARVCARRMVDADPGLHWPEHALLGEELLSADRELAPDALWA